MIKPLRVPGQEPAHEFRRASTYFEGQGEELTEEELAMLRSKTVDASIREETEAANKLKWQGRGGRRPNRIR